MTQLFKSLQRAQALVAIASTLCGAAFFSSAALADPAAQKRAEDEVRKVVHEYIATYATTDMEKYFSYYADDMSICCWDGWWSKKAYYTMWTDLVKKGGGAAKAEVRELRLQSSPSGDTVIATHQLPVIDRKPEPGQPADIIYNMTEVWMKNSGKWQIVNLTFSYAKANEPGPVTMLSRSK